MLADQVVSLPICGGDLGKKSEDALRMAMRMAKRFVLSESFTAAVDLTVGENPAGIALSITDLVDYARPPAPVTWMECLCADRPRWRSKMDRSKLDPEERLPVRVGILIHQRNVDDVTWEMNLFWKPESLPGEEIGVMTSPLALVLDLSGGGASDELNPITKRTTETDVRAAYPDLTDKQMAGAMKLSEVFGRQTLSTWWLLSLSGMRAEFEKPRVIEVWNKIIQRAQTDWVGEPAFWTTALALLAARNAAVTEERPEPVRLNKARVRSGKMPLFGYHVLKLHPRWLPQKSEGGPGLEHGVRHHFVRGHFKRRRSGLYWWSPHMRGNPELGTVEKDYEVTA